MKTISVRQLPQDKRKVFIHIIRELAKVQLPHWVNKYGLEKSEEMIIDLIDAKQLKLIWDKSKDEFHLEIAKI